MIDHRSLWVVQKKIRRPNGPWGWSFKSRALPAQEHVQTQSLDIGASCPHLGGCCLQVHVIYLGRLFTLMVESLWHYLHVPPPVRLVRLACESSERLHSTCAE